MPLHQGARAGRPHGRRLRRQAGSVSDRVPVRAAGAARRIGRCAWSSRARRPSSAAARAIRARSGSSRASRRTAPSPRARRASPSTRGAYGSHSPGVTAVGTAALTSLYRCDNVHLEGQCVYTNTPIAGAYRGYGVVQTYYALDIQMDEAAEQLGMDPAELKLKNAVREGDIAPSGHPIIGHGLEDCIRRGREETDWAELRRRARNEQGPIRTRLGHGLRDARPQRVPGHQGTGQCRREDERGRHGDSCSPVPPGWAPAPTPRSRRSWPRSSACNFEDVAVVHGDTDVVPWDIGAFASHTTYHGRARGADGGRGGEAAAAGTGGDRTGGRRRRSAGSGGRHLGQGRARLSHARPCATSSRPRRGCPLRISSASAPTSRPSPIRLRRTSSQVKVDTETGQIDVLQVIPVHEIGKVIHPIAAAGQIEGGIQQGIGHTLTEDYVVDSTTGRSLNAELRRLQDAAVDGHAADPHHHARRRRPTRRAIRRQGRGRGPDHRHRARDRQRGLRRDRGALPGTTRSRRRRCCKA